MARKTNGNGTATRSLKTTTSIQPAAVQVAPGLGKDVPTNGKLINLDPVNLEEEIRRRAYEIYLERRATAGGECGNENQDWLMAESEIRSRHGRLARHTTA
ncbi:MAG: DUF2934 domain-containing protein [Terriglobales bacterium]|jgi:hypothetical protein